MSDIHKIECEILGLSSSPSTGGAYALLLKEAMGTRRLPIIIGQFEAQAIALELEGIRPPRPLTHDLMKNMIEDLGVTVNEIVVHELKDNTFFAKIIVEMSGFTNEIDARPSDAIAIAVRVKAPIFVSESVLLEASFQPNEETGEFSGPGTEMESSQEQQSTPPPSSKEAKLTALQNQLREALEVEEYERAAKLRDEIKKMTENN